MATLVLSTVGTVLGGPLGGAIGSLIGQSIDQQLFSSPKHGPRLGDLSVQTSSYGTPIPRIYGTMRVAGSVVWSTDLVESSTTTGAKGQPDTTTYSYSVSFAVALSSRPAGAIKRIWADGKLLRGAAGDFKTNTGFRYYDGSEDQPIDPLIGSIEGITQTPAYRGLALAMFENLELADYGNRIPFLTFEVEADAAAPWLQAVLGDASGGRIACDSIETIIGYAAHGATIRAAVEPLAEAFGIQLFDDGAKLRSAVDPSAMPISEAEFGNSASLESAPAIQRAQEPARALPNALSLSYYDAARDYQTGRARASASEQAGSEDQSELAAVLDAQSAKGLAEQMLARRWARRDTLTLRLPPSRITIEPGSTVELALSPSCWTVERCTIEGMVALVELRPAYAPPAVIAADSGRAAAAADAVQGEVSLALFDLPDPGASSSTSPSLYLAATSATPGWRAVPVEILAAGSLSAGRTSRRKTVLGRSLTMLGNGQPYLIDLESSVEIELIDPEQWLVSCDEEALVNGANFAVLGGELIQFGEAESIGAGKFRLRRLLRGRRGTEWAMDLHGQGDDFALIEPDALQRIEFPAWTSGSEIIVSAGGAHGSVGNSIRGLVTGESLRPPSPEHLKATLTATGDIAASWIRRSRSGWAWIDELDAPLGEAREDYRIAVEGSAGSIEVQSSVAAITIGAAALTPVGAGPATISVRQVGDFAVSHAAQTSIILIQGDH